MGLNYFFIKNMVFFTIFVFTLVGLSLFTRRIKILAERENKTVNCLTLEILMVLCVIVIFNILFIITLGCNNPEFIVKIFGEFNNNASNFVTAEETISMTLTTTQLQDRIIFSVLGILAIAVAVYVTVNKRLKNMY